MSLRVMPQKYGYQVHSVLCVILMVPRKGASVAIGGNSNDNGASAKPGMSGPEMMKPMPVRWAVLRRQLQRSRAVLTPKRASMPGEVAVPAASSCLSVSPFSSQMLCGRAGA